MEPQQPNSPHPQTLEQPTPALVTEIVWTAQYIYATYGWVIFGCLALLLFAWSKFKPHYEAWRMRQDENELAALHHKNPNLIISRQEAVERARRRMQEEHDQMARMKAERAKELEEQKRQEWLARQSGTGGHRLCDKAENSKFESEPGPSKKKAPTFRPEYHPLMGAGSSNGYRPPKRGCPGGGCGKK